MGFKKIIIVYYNPSGDREQTLTLTLNKALEVDTFCEAKAKVQSIVGKEPFHLRGENYTCEWTRDGIKEGYLNNTGIVPRGTF